MQNLNFVALPVPETIGVTGKKLGSPWIHARSLLLIIIMQMKGLHNTKEKNNDSW